MSVSDQASGEHGVVFGPYRVFQRIGVGGMATVHRAKEIGIEGFERWVALKRLLPHLAEDASFVRSFVREAKLASMLAHPSIVQIYELGRVGHVYFISMELIEGFDVRQILRQARRYTGPPPIAITVAILSQICDALEYAHTRVDDSGQPLGLVHRDVSPSNVIVAHGGHLKIIDFGIAKAQIQQLQTNTGKVKGKMAYMSPEAIRGLEIDGRSDLFSLGVLAHELLTARPLFATKNDYKTLQRVQNATIAPPSTFNRDCPPELDAIVLRALERDRDHRWQSAGEMLSELVSLRQQYQLQAQPRDVATWLELAFDSDAVPIARLGATTTSRSHVETPEPDTSAPSIVIEPHEVPYLRTPVTGPTGPASIPVGKVALPVAEDDDEIVEIAWGGRSSHSGVVLEEVPDVSSRGIVAQGLTPVPAASRTLIAPAPPPPERKRTEPRHWATGTLPGGDDELRLDRFPLAPPASEAPPTSMKRPPTAGSGPHVRYRKRATTSAPIVAPAAAPQPAHPPRRSATHRVGGATSIGASIVERRGGARLRLAIGAAIVAAIAVAAVLVIPRLGGGAGVGAAAVSRDASRIKLVVEPADAVVTVESVGVLEGAPATTSLEPGSYDVEVRREGYKTWTSRIEVVARENQTLRIVLAAEASPAASAMVGVEAAPADESRRSRRKRDGDRSDDDDDDRRRSGERSAPVLEQPDQPMLARESTAPSPLPRAGIPMALDAVEPPTTRARRPAPNKGPILVPPNAVRKQSGNVPRLRDRAGDVPPRMAAELCIDFRGVVKTARLISPVSDRVKEQVETALRDWRYDPYIVDGDRVDACFAVTFKTR